MLFAIQWEFACEARDAVDARFKETGAPPPDGVKIIGRWHSLGENCGFLICEADDPLAIGRLTREWSDLLKFKVSPVTDDQGVAAILS